MTNRPFFALAALALATVTPLAAQEKLIHVELSYAAPSAVAGTPKTNFSPKGMQVELVDVPTAMKLPRGATRPAKIGTMKLGSETTAYVPILLTSTSAFPKDLTQLYIDRNRNGNFTDDSLPMTATPKQNEKTKAWWSSFDATELLLPYATTKAVERYSVNFWAVREDSFPAPEVIRFSVHSWRTGKVTVNGVEALVAAMDDNNAIWDKDDWWSVIGANEKNAPNMVLSSAEARTTNRLMFIPNGDKEMVLEFRGFSPDGRSVDFAVVDKMISKKSDRAPDDALREERPRPRATVPFVWEKTLEAAMARAKAEGKKVFVDFATTWCGPCASMDQWIYTDLEVAGELNAGYVGVKLDGDIEKAAVKKYTVTGYPTMIIADPAGATLDKFTGYMSSKELLAMLAKQK